ncbi:DNA polymerase III, delta subunit [Arenibacter palladensis]|uniref:DNA polymerase III subunit delta n=1 Tax=Arenibacter palladensis TaxID=237373 RepID=A0A1M4XIT4_9FLAO|nr:DNA polymerase III subunit delta [Arenibacter palladensis]MDO6602695.1 DNA polymerase III subunit delta [Arenibacter palladensis]SHE93567.1 DNA polymerase III, delta subunit [Arenibacter palladensis]|tara:strand:- start:4381 stop:5379 length:999 start_codon:yes stop_codon:yes gene_type:complete
MDEVKQIVSNIKKGDIAPIYFLTGEEPYYIDKIAEYIEKNALTEEERGFNQVVLYGKEITIEDIVSNAKRYPMMAERQVVIVKEAQHLSRTIENLVSYADQPQPSTILVLCYKYNKLDKRKKLYKSIKKSGVIFEGKKLYENQVGDWIKKSLHSRGYGITFKAANLLVEFLGTDLGKIDKELEKLCLVVPKGVEINPEVIESNIGISKDYNNFELKKAIGERDVEKATRIVNYFAQNPKDNPFVLTVTLLYSFFIQLLSYHGLKDHSPKSVSTALGIRPFFVSEIQTAARNYPMRRVSEIISGLRELDVKGKGVGSNISQADLLKELLIKIF